MSRRTTKGKKRFDTVNRPKHYALDPEPIVIIENWNLGYCLGQVIKYVSRAGRKDKGKEVEDLLKAAWYLRRRIGQLKTAKREEKKGGRVG